MNAPASNTNAQLSGITDKKGLKEAFFFPSLETVDRLRRQKKIPAIKLGYRSYIHDLAAVRRALEKLTVKEVGA